MGYAEAQYAADTAAKKVNSRIDELVVQQYGGQTPPMTVGISTTSVKNDVTVSVNIIAVSKREEQSMDGSGSYSVTGTCIVDKVRIVGKRDGVPSFDDYDVMKEVDASDFEPSTSGDGWSHTAQVVFDDLDTGTWSFAALTRSDRGVWNKYVYSEGGSSYNYAGNVIAQPNEIDDRLFGFELIANSNKFEKYTTVKISLADRPVPSTECANGFPESNNINTWKNIKTRYDSATNASSATLGDWTGWKWLQKIKPFIVDTNGRAVQQLDPDDFTKQANGEPSLLASDPNGDTLNDYAGIYAWIPRLYEGSLYFPHSTNSSARVYDMTIKNDEALTAGSALYDLTIGVVFSESKTQIAKSRGYTYRNTSIWTSGNSLSLTPMCPGFIDENGEELLGCWIPCYYGDIQNGHGVSWPDREIDSRSGWDNTTIMNEVSGNGSTRIRCFGGPIMNLLADVLCMMGKEGDFQNDYACGFSNMENGPGSGRGPVTLACHPAGSGFFGQDNMGWNKVFHSIVLGSFVNRLVDPYTGVLRNSLYIQNRITPNLDTSHMIRVGGLSPKMGSSWGISTGSYRLGYAQALYSGYGIDGDDEVTDPNGYGDGDHTNIGLNPVTYCNDGSPFNPHTQSDWFDYDALLFSTMADSNDSPWPVFRLGAYGDGALAGPRMMVGGINGNNDPSQLTQTKNTYACMVLPPKDYEPTIML